MTKYLKTLALILLFASAFGGVIRGEQQPPAQTASAVQVRTEQVSTPLKIQIVISRYQGDRKLSSLPYALSTVVIGRDRATASIRVGAQVPVPSASFTPLAADGKPGPAVSSVQYRSIGTNIDCNTQSTDDGRFRITVNIDDSSVYSDGQTAQAEARNEVPTFRTFSSNTALILKDGQSGEFVAATDKVSGETTKVEVTITVVK